MNSYRCRPCGAPLTGAAKCEYCGCLTHALSTTPGEIVTYLPGGLPPDDHQRHLQAHLELQRAAMMQNHASFHQRGMLFGGAASGVLGGLFR